MAWAELLERGLPILPGRQFKKDEEAGLPDLRTPRLRLIAQTVRHAAPMYPILKDTSIYAFADDEPPSSVGALRERFARLEERKSPDNREAWFNWVIRRSTFGYIGYVQATVQAVPVVRAAEIAWVLGAKWRGQGYAAEAVAAMIDYLGSIGVAKLRARIHRDNTASQSVAERCGLKRTSSDLTAESEIWFERWL
jgi:RimJ/RimL family protein N-acetyltransferase